MSQPIPDRPARRAATAAAAPPAPRWLLLVHQLPPTPSNLRVRTWRRLQQIGAIPLKQAVYALPDSPAAREDLEWLKTEIQSSGGEASVLLASHIDVFSDDELVEAFRRARQDDYAVLARDIEAALAKLERRSRRSAGQRAPAIGRLSRILGQRLASIEAIDFFGSAGRDRVRSLLDRLSAPSASRAAHVAGTPPARYRNRLWVTRPRPGVDRMASAWLIRRFIDPDARFDFVADRPAAPAEAVPFDMFGGEFTHRGDSCTFETLCQAFEIHDRAVARLAEIVHDLDLKDARFGAPEQATVSSLIDGLQLAHADDQVLLEHGITMFESLYRSFSRAAAPARPRQVAKRAARPRRR